MQKHPWYPIWAFAVLTVMRSGELLALEWGDVDEQNEII
jgi:integrase